MVRDPRPGRVGAESGRAGSDAWRFEKRTTRRRARLPGPMGGVRSRSAVSSMPCMPTCCRSPGARSVPTWRRRSSASDIVQETFLAAGRDIAQFRGAGPAELRGWLKGILKHLLSNTRRHYRETRKRRVDREMGGDDAAPGLWATISASATSPSGCAMRREREDALQRVLLTLPRALSGGHPVAPPGTPGIRRDRRAAGHLGGGCAEGLGAGAAAAARGIGARP